MNNTPTDYYYTSTNRVMLLYPLIYRVYSYELEGLTYPLSKHTLREPKGVIVPNVRH